MRKKTKSFNYIRKKFLLLSCFILGISAGAGSSLLRQREQVSQGLTKSPEIHFSPEDAKLNSMQADIATFIIEKINQASSSIHIAMFSFTHDGIAEALIKAKQRGVRVYVFADATQGASKYAKLAKLAKYIDAVYIGPKSKTVHHKYAIIDKRGVLTGSANWSKNGYKNNRDQCLYIEEEEVATTFKKNWDACIEAQGVLHFGRLH